MSGRAKIMTERAKIANVRSMMEHGQGKADRRGLKTSRSKAAVQSSARDSQLRAANDSVSLVNQARADLVNMEEPRILTDKQLDQLSIVHPRCGDKAIVDAMRQLRTKLYQLRPEGNFSVMVSSVVPEGGGSFVSLNLAATIAFDQAKTSMLIEANLHSPVLHKLMKLVGQTHDDGLLDYLEQPELGAEHIIKPSGVPRMRVVPLGQQSEISNGHFTSARFRHLMDDIRDRYNNRYVVIDAPSMSTSADARILSEICDFTVLVIPYGGVTPGALDSAIEQIDKRKLAGIVMNNQP